MKLNYEDAHEVFSFGKNDSGQLGITPYSATQNTPKLIENLKAIKTACGYYHTVAISIENLLYTWGRNDSGQLGVGDKVEKELVPVCIEDMADKQVIQIACGCYHTLTLTSKR